MISVSDHETGGLALGRQLTEKYPVYAWYPEVLANASHSTAWLAKKISLSHQPSQPISRQFIVDDVLKDGLGIIDASDEEIDKLVSLGARQNVDYILADMVDILS
jgi:alkaline phosphatase